MKGFWGESQTGKKRVRPAKWGSGETKLEKGGGERYSNALGKRCRRWTASRHLYRMPSRGEGHRKKDPGGGPSQTQRSTSQRGLRRGSHVPFQEKKALLGEKLRKKEGKQKNPG